MMDKDIPKSVLIFIQNGLGGAERIQIEIGKMLISDGWCVRYCRIAPKGSLDKIEKFYPLEAEKSEIGYTSQLNLIKCIYNQIKSFRPNVVFASAMHLNQRILLLSPLFPKIKFVVRNDNYLYTLPKWKRITLALTYRSADMIISQTEEMEEELKKIGIKSKKITTLHNPVDIEEIERKSLMFLPFLDDEKIRFVSIGRFAYQKGFDILVEAYNIVSKKLPNSELYIVGNIDYGNRVVFSQLTNLVEKYHLSNKVFFPGFKDNPYPYIARSNVFVLSSRFEGLPNAMIEALTLGIPCVATSCIPIISRIIDEGKNGYIVEIDDVEGLAAAMINATKIARVENSYIPASKEDFISLFDQVTK